MLNIDVPTLTIAMTLNLAIMAIALPYLMGRSDRAARAAQLGIALQAAGWIFLLASTLCERGGPFDRLLSVCAMASVSGGMVFNAIAFELWYGRRGSARLAAAIAVLMTAGYGLSYDNYAFRVAWANGLLALQIATVVVSLCLPPQLPVGRWRWLLVTSLSIQMIVLGWRAVLGGFYTEQFPSFFAPYLINQVFSLTSNAMMLLSVVAILLAHRDVVARELERLATIDGLTGALNRRAWRELASTTVADSIRYRHSIGVLLLDLDFFKQINDSCGHAAGDRALQFFVTALRAVSRSTDVFCRYGGEEFCVMLKHADLAAITAYDARLRQWLLQNAAAQLDFGLSYSGGIALYQHAHDSLDAMLQRADVALYAAKAQGRGRTLI